MRQNNLSIHSGKSLFRQWKKYWCRDLINRLFFVVWLNQHCKRQTRIYLSHVKDMPNSLLIAALSRWLIVVSNQIINEGSLLPVNSVPLPTTYYEYFLSNDYDLFLILTMDTSRIMAFYKLLYMNHTKLLNETRFKLLITITRNHRCIRNELNNITENQTFIPDLARWKFAASLGTSNYIQFLDHSYPTIKYWFLTFSLVVNVQPGLY